MLVSGKLYQLPPLAHPTEGNESGSSAWMSPISQDAKHSGHALTDKGAKLCHQVLNWPTATSRDHKDGTARSCENVDDNGLLGRVIHKFSGPPSTATGRADPVKPSTDGNRQELWATPMAQNDRGGSCDFSRKVEVELGMRETVNGKKTNPTNAKLNPHWVMTLMGYPPLWAELGRKFTTESRNSKARAIP